MPSLPHAFAGRAPVAGLCLLPGGLAPHAPPCIGIAAPGPRRPTVAARFRRAFDQLRKCYVLRRT